ncbi:MAG: alanine/glycine:cation symporter family protein [Anaerococcus hydrogenalis]|uniref:alanine/glycine:cation symporter family protein n=1 Tax=Anaerococcus hydrogenalis TaxID=33029 RepID=UPI00290070EF|nr:alanine/glycine:cation symporter family protein [Anaerococcus hydrogenalis]MDU2582094.1 alanine/glycine:cation symporter family protein [Anaerococcus hydrogenalis]
MLEKISNFLGPINGILYYPILIILLLTIGIFFTVRTNFLQVRLLKESIKVVMEKPEEKGSVSSFQALMVSTASRVGSGNIVGISTAICLGGYGSVFWMWIVAIIGGASAFIESTLAQIYKKRDENNKSYGGPAYYIEQGLKSRKLGVIFAISLILTYAIGFNMLASFNLQTSFMTYDFYDPNVTPFIVGLILAAITGICVFGGGDRIIKFTSTIVPFMGVIYILVAIIMIIVNINYIPIVFANIFRDAFNFRSIFAGLASSSMIYGIKRGLYSNEAGIGSAPNAAASANISHPAKQGLVQMLSVFIDTLLICTATAFMCLSSGIEPSEALSGAPYVQESLTTLLGGFGNYFISFSLSLFTFTTLIGNLFYVDSNLSYIHKKTPSKRFMLIFRIFAVLVILLGAMSEVKLAWDISDFLMGIMALINLPSILVLSKKSIDCLKDYEKQRSEGKNPIFKSDDIGIMDKLDYWD